MTVTIENLKDGTSETLAPSSTVLASMAITHTYSNGVLTLSGVDTVAHYQSVLQSITYNDTATSPNSTPRTITFVATDGGRTVPQRSQPCISRPQVARWTVRWAAVIWPSKSPGNRDTVRRTRKGEVRLLPRSVLFQPATASSACQDFRTDIASRRQTLVPKNRWSRG